MTLLKKDIQPLHIDLIKPEALCFRLFIALSVSLSFTIFGMILIDNNKDRIHFFNVILSDFGKSKGF